MLQSCRSTHQLLKIQVMEILYFLTTIAEHAKKEDPGIQHPAARVAREILWPEVRNTCMTLEMYKPLKCALVHFLQAMVTIISVAFNIEYSLAKQNYISRSMN